jgi:hypothetical protein
MYKLFIKKIDKNAGFPWVIVVEYNGRKVIIEGYTDYESARAFYKANNGEIDESYIIDRMRLREHNGYITYLD